MEMVEEKVLVIDPGSSRIRMALYNVNRKGVVKTIAVSEAPARGIKNGNIVNFPSAKESLRSTLNKLKLESPVPVPAEAYVLLSGAHTLSYTVESRVSFPGIQTVSYSDINDVKRKAKKELLNKLGQAVKQHYELIHIIPQEFMIENLTGIQNPVGHSGRELSMKAFVVLASKSALKTLETILKEINLRLKGTILQSLAAIYGFRDERTYLNNNLVIYLGAGNTEYFYFREDRPVLNRHIPFGSEDIISFIISKLKVSRKEAERLFLEYGSAYAFNVDKEEVISVNYGTNSRRIPRILIPILIQIQLQSVFKDIRNNLNAKDASIVPNLNRIYLTGGLSKLKDINLLVSKVFKSPAQVCETASERYRDPSYGPALGVAKFLSSMRNRKKLVDIREDFLKEQEKGSFIGHLLRFITDFV